MAEMGDQHQSHKPVERGMGGTPPLPASDSHATVDPYRGPMMATGQRPGTSSSIPTSNGMRAPQRRAPRLVVLPALLLVLVVGSAVGYSYWQDQQLYVSTDNAQVTGALVQVGSLNAGRIESISVDVGDRVNRDQVLATIVLPSVMGQTSAGVPRMDFSYTDDARVAVRSPIEGVVVHRQSNVGDTVAVGQPIITLVDPAQLWVQAEVEETRIGRVRPGQVVEVRIDSLGRSLPGRVAAVGRATAATFSLLPSSNASGNFTKVTQLVPVKIALDYGDLPLVLGSSVQVKIRVQE